MQLVERVYEVAELPGRSGAIHKLHSQIDPEEGKLLFDIIQNDAGIVKTLEIGCAFGLSSLHICLALNGRKGALHSIIDPFQNSHWDGAGIRLLEDSGIDCFQLIETRSEFALPRLAEEGEGRFDFVFVDGWHTFDHTLVDCFFALRLLRVGGVLVIDDVNMRAVNRVAEFLRNYPCLQPVDAVGRRKDPSWKRVLARLLLLPVPPRFCKRVLRPGLYQRIFVNHSERMLALKKVAEDTRDWNWHDDNF